MEGRQRRGLVPSPRRRGDLFARGAANTGNTGKRVEGQAGRLHHRDRMGGRQIGWQGPPESLVGSERLAAIEPVDIEPTVGQRVYFFFARAASIASQADSGSIVKSLNSPAPRSHFAPSITTHSPLMYSAISLSRKAARLVSSSWRPKRFIGFFSLSCSSNCFEGIRRDHAPSVGKGPGAMAFRRM